MKFKGLTIFQQFVALGTVVFVVLGVFLSSLITPTLTSFILEQQKLNSVVFANRLAAEFLRSEDFAAPAASESSSRFENFVLNLQIPGLFRTKIWNREGIIVYSDKQELIGKQFPLTRAFERALDLETVVELKTFDPEDGRYIYESSFGEGMVILAPLTFGASPEVVGVLETYARTGFLREQIQEIRDLFAQRIVVSLVIMFAALSLIVWQASRTLTEQQVALKSYATSLEAMVKERTEKLEEAMKRELQHAEEISRMKDEFVSLASHQLRTPPATVNWYAEILLSGDLGKLNDEQQKYLEEIFKANKRMIGLVNDFLNISRIELGTLTVEPQPTNLVEAAESVLAELEPQIKRKETQIQKHFVSNLPIISTDPKLMRIVFQNLLSNAVKYTPPRGTVAVAIEKHLEPQAIGIPGSAGGESHVFVTVSDTGYGIPAFQRDKIFTKLFRADNVKTKETEGTGLGLYLVKAIIERCGGTIWFESEEGKGTTFCVSLPLAFTETPEKKRIQERARSGPECSHCKQHKALYNKTA
ncbi:sensor histidine kinase [Candidatus Parcubacteria bacterium]|nr:MAG: sensor histidine kinase [Candidatus Parcubacteria bacterium]